MEDVLVVGAGPTGLMLAIELRRRGIPHRIIERAPARHTQSRATDIQSRTLEIFHDLEVCERIVGMGKPRSRVSMWVKGKKLLDVTTESIDSPYPYTIGLEQHHTERVLEQRLEELGGKVERGVRLATLEQDAKGVSAVLLHDDGRWKEERFAYVAGCDGAHSAVRHAMGFAFEGRAFDETFFLADVAIGEGLTEHETALFVSDVGMTILLPIPGKRWVRMFGDLAPGETEPTIDRAFCEDVLAKRALPCRVDDVGWTATFHVSSRQVGAYRKGRVFLCGDAAHVHSPAGGHGMNTGIQDAYNLGWKLALVCAGKASPALLDSYHDERHPVGKALIASTDMETRLAMWRSRYGQEMIMSLMGLATRLPGVQQRMLANAVEIDISYRASRIVGERTTSLLLADVVHDAARESPSVGDVRSFASAPRAGDRAPDVRLPSGTLFDRLRGATHQLLLFDGRSNTRAGYENLAAIARRCRARHAGLVEPHVIVLGERRPDELEFDGSVVLDDGRIHDRYGAGSECLYVVRPDGHIGFRSQPAVDADVDGYFERLLA